MWGFDRQRPLPERRLKLRFFFFQNPLRLIL
jgi:hypothetical protein